MMRAKLLPISSIVLSPYILLLLLLSSLIFQQTQSLTTDGVLLLSFKYSILSDPLHVLDTWSYFDDTPCYWRGVSCVPPNVSTTSQDTHGGTWVGGPRVVSVSLPNSQLLGSIPADLGLLDTLQSLNLSGNSINGTLPSSLFSLTRIRYLDLSNNLITGDLPDLVSGLRGLEVLNLSENALSGNIPTNLASLENLTDVSLRGNYFSGNLPTGFNQVRVMDLSSNLLNGSLPVDFGGENLQYLNLSYNRISGEISPEFPRKIPLNATLDLSYNNLTGEIPDVSVLSNQERESFTGNFDLCGPPSGNPCPIPSSPTSLPVASDQPIPPPAFAAIPKTLDTPATVSGSPAGAPAKPQHKDKSNGLRPHTIAAIVVGDLAGIAIVAMAFLYVYRKKSTTTTKTEHHKGTPPPNATVTRELSSSSSCSSSSSESKGMAKWSCLRKDQSENDDEEEEEEEGENEKRGRQQEQGKLVTVDDGERVLELETLLKASAYILGASGTSIIYKAVLEDGSVLAVRRVGDCCGAERLKDFESHVRGIAKLVHPNLVRVRGFYWGADEKLVIYEYVPNGSLANARYRKTGSSPCHIPWEVRLRIAKGLARGLSYIHEKKHVHGNIKPSNILLDMDMEPKIADFGLERLTTGKSGYMPGGSTRHFGSKRSTASRDSFQDCSVGATPSPSASSMGCFSPYHPPESLRSLKPNPKWDVYSFGVVLLELLTGKVVVSDEQLGPPVLAGLAVGLEDPTRVLRMADAAIRGEMEGKEDILFCCLKLGYNCVSHVPQKRPSMKEVLQVLEKIPASSTLSYYYGP